MAVQIPLQNMVSLPFAIYPEVDAHFTMHLRLRSVYVSPYFLFSSLLIFSPLLSWCFPFSVFIFTLVLTPLSNNIPLLLVFLPNFSDCPYSPCILPLSSPPWLPVHSPRYILSFPLIPPSTSHSASPRLLGLPPAPSSSALLLSPCLLFQSQATRGSVAHRSNTFILSPISSVLSASPLFSCSSCLPTACQHKKHTNL